MPRCPWSPSPASCSYRAFLSGSIVVETVFASPGVARLLLLDAVTSRDYPLVQAGVLFVATLYILVNFSGGRAVRLPEPADQVRLAMAADAIGPSPGCQLRATGLRATLARLPLFSLAVLALLLIAAVAAPLLTPYSPTEGDLRGTACCRPPGKRGASMDHLLGTDRQGRDILTRIIYGTRVSSSGRPAGDLRRGHHRHRRRRRRGLLRRLGGLRS